MNVFSKFQASTDQITLWTRLIAHELGHMPHSDNYLCELVIRYIQSKYLVEDIWIESGASYRLVFKLAEKTERNKNADKRAECYIHVDSIACDNRVRIYPQRGSRFAVSPLTIDVNHPESIDVLDKYLLTLNLDKYERSL